MPLIEDADYNALIERANKGDAAAPSKALLDMMAANPKTRRRVLELVKEIRPDLSIPELDATASVSAEAKAASDRVTALEEKLEKQEKERAERERERSMTSTVEEHRNRLRAQGYQAEGIAAVEKLMVDRGLTDYEAAAALLEREQPREDMVIPNYDRSWSGFTPADDDAEHKLLVRDKNSHRQWQHNQIRKFFDEKRRGVLRV